MTLEEANALQVGLIQDFSEREKLPARDAAMRWCTDGHAERCRQLIEGGVPAFMITNKLIEDMNSNEV